jgi:GAF domain-containing protein
MNMTEKISGASEGLDDSVPGVDSQDEAATQDMDLRESLADLSGLVMGAGQRGLEDMLTHVAAFAVRAIPGADGAGLTLLEEGRADTMVASAEFVREVDAIQYGIGEGPCITAATERRTVHSGSLGGDRQWPRFGPRVGRLGVHSVLSLPLVAGESVLGAMNVYAHAKDAFDDRAVELGELFAAQAAISVQNAQALAQARRLATQLQAALTSRAVIDQAVGILMSRTGCTAGEAFDKLRVISQTENRKSSAVAQSILDEAVRRARARHVGD